MLIINKYMYQGWNIFSRMRCENVKILWNSWKIDFIISYCIYEFIFIWYNWIHET